MSELSEEEIIEEVEKELKLAKNIDDVAVTIRNEYIQGLLDLYQKEKEKNKAVRDRIEYYLLDNMSLENNPEKLGKELIKLKELLEERN